MKRLSQATLVFLSLILIIAMPGRANAQMESFFCDGAISFNALFAPNGESVLLEFTGHDRFVLKQVPSGSGTRYAGRGYILHGKDNDWTLTPRGDETVRCARASSNSDDNYAPQGDDDEFQVIFPIDGHSFGGNVRTGPSINRSQKDSLHEGDPITILSNTGQSMGEYDWFKIRFRGRIGYQWGGIMCANDAEVPGILSVCPYFEKNIVPVSPRRLLSPRERAKLCSQGQYWSLSRERCIWYSQSNNKWQKRGCRRGQYWSPGRRRCVWHKGGQNKQWRNPCGQGKYWHAGKERCLWFNNARNRKNWKQKKQQKQFEKNLQQGIKQIQKLFDKDKKKKGCPKGQVWNKKSKKCVKHAVKAKPKKSKNNKKKNGCPKGQVWSKEGHQCRPKMEAFCGPGFRWSNSKKRCVSRS